MLYMGKCCGGRKKGETEKRMHVMYFLNGRKRERRRLIV
jgi:hypothetical protein